MTEQGVYEVTVLVKDEIYSGFSWVVITSLADGLPMKYTASQLTTLLNSGLYNEVKVKTIEPHN